MRRMRHLKPRELQSCDVAYQFWRPETLFDATSGGSPVAPGGAIARAEDVSGNGNHATQATAGARPTRQVAARNGIDVARFDGSNDFLDAGDVADMLANPVECYAVFIRTGPLGLKGIFGKSRANNSYGRWTLLVDTFFPTGDSFIFSGSVGVQAVLLSSTSLQILYGSHPRGTANATMQRNASTSSSAVSGDSGASFNTTDSLLVGSYQTSAGNPSFASSFLGGDIIECAKFSRNLGAQTRLRTQHAAMRRARIAG